MKLFAGTEAAALGEGPHGDVSPQSLPSHRVFITACPVAGLLKERGVAVVPW